MNASRYVYLKILRVLRRLLCHVKVEVANLAIKVVLVQVPFCTACPRYVNIRVNNSNTCKFESALQRGQLNGVPYKLGIIVLDDWRRYNVST